LSELFTIRPARREDCGTILALIRALGEYEKLADQIVATEEILEQWLFDKEKAEVLLAEEDGVVVGYALFFHNFSTFLGRAGVYLEDLFVLPEYRGRGYGRALLSRLAALTVERGCGRLEWSCLDWNQPSIDFYRAMGAQSMDGWTVYRLTGDTLTRAAELDNKE
jgi:GNAT superfamily N-acetyltransferase